MYWDIDTMRTTTQPHRLTSRVESHFKKRTLGPEVETVEAFNDRVIKRDTTEGFIAMETNTGS